MGCGICLCDDDHGTVKAPCGFEGARFHGQCLGTLLRKGIRRCPHCNVPLDDGLALMGQLVECWLCKQEPMVWSEKTCYIALAKGQLMPDGEQVKVVSTLLEKIKGQNATKNECVHVWNQEDRTFFSCLVAPACRIVLTLCRTAYYGTLGSIVCDGYALSATKSRTSSRRVML